MKTTTLLTAALMVLAAIAVPAVAHDDSDDDRSGRDGPSDERKDRMRDAHERTHERHDNATDKRGPSDEARDRFKERCEAYQNETGEQHRKCVVAAHVRDPCMKARRAAHAGLHAVGALEHRVVKLERFELRVLSALEDGNLTANETAEYEAKLDRIQAAQNKTIEKIDKVLERIEGLKDKCQSVRDHVSDRAKLAICHVDEDGNMTSLRIARQAWPAHEAHNDTLGACPDDEYEDDEYEVEDEEDGKPEEDGNSTADP